MRDRWKKENDTREASTKIEVKFGLENCDGRSVDAVVPLFQREKRPEEQAEKIWRSSEPRRVRAARQRRVIPRYIRPAKHHKLRKAYLYLPSSF